MSVYLGPCLLPCTCPIHGATPYLYFFSVHKVSVGSCCIHRLCVSVYMTQVPMNNQACWGCQQVWEGSGLGQQGQRGGSGGGHVWEGGGKAEGKAKEVSEGAAGGGGVDGGGQMDTAEIRK